MGTVEAPIEQNVLLVASFASGMAVVVPNLNFPSTVVMIPVSCLLFLAVKTGGLGAR